MEVYPRHIEQRLGFQTIRDRLVRLTGSDPGAVLAAACKPLPFEEAEREGRVVAALQRVREGGGMLPEAAFEPVAELVSTLRPKGSFLDPEALLHLRSFCACSESVRRFLQVEEAPGELRSLAARWHPVGDVVQAIDAVVDPDGTVKDSASDTLRKVRRDLRNAQSQVRKVLQRALREASSQGWAVEDQPTVRAGRMVIPVRAEAKRKLGGIVHDVSSTGQTAFVEPAESVQLNNEVRELEGAERREIVRLLQGVADQLRGHLEGIRENERLLGQYDLRRAKALLALKYDGVVPTRGDDGVVDLLGARNPELLLMGLEDGRSVVPLSLRLDGDHRMLVISGPNAGGKSVAMKTVGLLVYLLQCGIPIPALPGSRVDRFDRLMGDIGDEQSVEDDLSTFSSRLARTRQMVEAADSRTLVLIDEAGTGTDPAEGSALAQAALEQLAEAGARVVVTTHHATLKLFAHEHPMAVNAMMRFDESALTPTYEMEAGLPGASYAFEIAGRMGLPEAVVARGRALLGEDHVSMERLLASLQERNRILEEQIERQGREARKAADQRRILEDRLEALTGARDEIKGRALEEADRLLGGVNAQVERAIRQIRESQAAPDVVKKARQAISDTRDRVGKAQKKNRRRQDARKETPQPAATGPISAGDRVRIGHEGPTGEVIEVKADEAVVAIGPAHSRVALRRLVKVGGPAPQRVTVTARVEPAAARMRIDVRGKRALEAVGEVERFVDEALSAGLGRAEILHGKGTGALRTSIHDYLSGRSDIASFDEAPVDQGGAGVTVVSF